MKLLVTGLAGYESSRRMYLDEDVRKKLLERYSESFFDVLREPAFPDSRKLFGPRLEEALSEGLCESGADGGVLAALWRLLKRNGLGARFSQRDIPVLQQSVEIAELFELDPYRMDAEGLYVWLTEDADPLLRQAEAAGLPAAVIGRSTEGSAILRVDGEKESYLRRPGPDASWGVPVDKGRPEGAKACKSVRDK